MLDRLKPDLDAGRVVLGGCCLFEGCPKWKCHACGHEWGRPDDFDELHRPRREAEALPKGLWRHLQACIGISLEDETTLLGGHARRLAWTSGGAALALATAPVTSPWIGLVILAICWLPLAWNIVLRLLAVVFSAGLLTLIPWNRRAISPGAKALGFSALTLLEMILLIVVFAYAGGGLLSDAMSPQPH